MARSFTFLLTIYLSSFRIGAQECEPCTRNAFGDIEEPGHGGSAAFNCDNAAEAAKTLNNGTADCRDHQLMMWQRNCCPDPPNDHCVMCDTFTPDKIIPKFEHQQFGSPSIDFTCANVAERITYLDRDGVGSEVRETWYGCLGSQISLLIKCNPCSTEIVIILNEAAPELGVSVTDLRQSAACNVRAVRIFQIQRRQTLCLERHVLAGCLKLLLYHSKPAKILKRACSFQRFRFAATWMHRQHAPSAQKDKRSQNQPKKCFVGKLVPTCKSMPIGCRASLALDGLVDLLTIPSTLWQSVVWWTNRQPLRQRHPIVLHLGT